MLNVILRTLFVFAIIVAGLRFTGKRQIGQLQPFELVVTLLLAEMASTPIENPEKPFLFSLVPIITLLAVQIFLAYITLKSEKLRALICGTPNIIIKNGTIQRQELKKLRYNLNDMLEQLRAKDMPNVDDVEFAILETNGHLSVIPKSQKRPVTPSDLNISTNYEGIPYTLIMDGHIMHENLKKIDLDVSWLTEQLKPSALNPKDIFFAYIDTQGNFRFQPKP